MDLDSINEVINDMANEIARLEEKLAELQWIPCSERLPKEDVEVLVYLYGNVPVIAWVYSGRWCSEEFDIAKEDEPIAWMPLPQPYRGDDK